MFLHGVPLLAALLLATGVSLAPSVIPAQRRTCAAQEIPANSGAHYALEIPANRDAYSPQEILLPELTIGQTQKIPISGLNVENPAATQGAPPVSGNPERHRGEQLSTCFPLSQSTQPTPEDERQIVDKPTDKQQTDYELTILREWRAGIPVSAAAVELFGEERCFSAAEIDDRHFSRIYGKSYKEACPVPRAELRYLRVLHRDLEGRIVPGEMICNRAIAGELVDIFRTLYKAGYPIERMVLIDQYDADDTRSMEANNSSSFNFRTVAGSAALSKHSRHQPALQSLRQQAQRTHRRRTRGGPRLCRPQPELSLQDRPRGPLLQGVHPPWIHLGRRLAQPERLPAFRKERVAVQTVMSSLTN